MTRIVELSKDTKICLIDTIKRGKEVSVTQWRMMKLWASDHVSRLSSPVSRVKTGHWRHVATMPNIEERGDWCSVVAWWPYQAENVPSRRTKHHLMRRENLESESSVL